MRSKNWQQVESIFHTALALGGDERITYLSEKCSGNTALLSEVESLLVAFENESGFLEDSAFNLGLNVLGQDDEKDLTGEKIGFYEIKEKLGGGGMGVVYLAEDTRLNRRVALKFLKKTFADDKWAKKQFINEAQAVARLEHPNICAVHSIEEIDEHNFIVMQYIEGATLAEIIPERQLTLEKILSVVNQIVSAVSSAHSHGIIHRDIKPGNIMITPEGLVKVLDFGLAKVVEHKQKRAEENISQMSQNGLILGTVSYMSPEQLRGEKLDYRTDIFSVGIVLYEMLTGKRPFNRNSQAETIAAILSDAPARLKDGGLQIPESLDLIVQKCLNKDKEKRFQSTAEILVELENIKDGIPVKSFLSEIYRYAALVILFLIITGSVFFIYQNSAGKKIRTLAVLPFTNESQQADKDYLCGTLSDELRNKFSRLSKLKVIAQPIVSKYSGQDVNPQTAGSELNADVVLAGKLIRKENALTLKVNLVNVADGTAVLEEEYKLEDTELIFIEQNLTAHIIEKLDPPVSEAEKNKISKQETKDPDAKRLYFLGRYYWNQQYGKNMKLALDYFKQATELDPYYAEAWSGLADTYASYSVPSVESPMLPAEAVRLARAAAKNALDINADLSEPYNSLGVIALRHEWKWSEAESNFRKAIDLKPDYSAAHYNYSILLAVTGRFEDALAAAEKAREFDPFSANIEMNVGRIYYYKGNFDQTNQIYTQLLEKDPNNVRIRYGLGLLYLKLGKIIEGTALLEQVARQNKPLAAAALGYAYAKAGRKTEALQLLNELEEISKDGFVSSQERAIIYFGLNDRQKAFENLDKACYENFPAFPFLLIDPLFEEFRSDARFAEIRKCANF